MQRAEFLSQRLNCHAADTYGPDSDKVFLPASFLKHLVAKYTEAHMPYPLTVRIPSRAPGAKTVYCGVRDFDSEEGRIGLPTSLLEQLPTASDNAVVTVEHVVLEKGTQATFKVLHSDDRKQSGGGDLRNYLERHLTKHLTVLFVGEIIRLRVPGWNEPLMFEITWLDGQNAVDIIDTDLTVDIIDDKDQSIIGGNSKTESGGNLAIDAVPLDIEIAPGTTRVFTLHIPAMTSAANVLLECQPGGSDASLVASRLVHDVSEIDNDWSDYSAPSNMRKELHISRTHSQLRSTDGAVNIYVGIIADAADAAPSVSAGFKGSISVLSSQDEPEIDTVSGNGSTHNEDALLCSNCNAGISKGNFEMHRLVCERHNYRCEGCNSVLRRNSDEARNHWHCDLCHIPGSLGDEEKHVRLFHTPCKCTCDNGELEFDSAAELVKHRRTDCADRLIECRFCRSSCPQGPPDDNLTAKLEGLRQHEWGCGNRTIACAQCSKRVAIRLVVAHMQAHKRDADIRLASRVSCANKLCDGERSSGNPLGLCAMCYGPLYASIYDPGYMKLLRRLRRLLYLQMARGCGNTTCSNRGLYCATGLSDAEINAKADIIIDAYTPLVRNTEGTQPTVFDDIDLHICK
ncbi:hypothetical protein EV175_000988 [Coemansia sp. RSA 1933]|nr:hypothetical protein EV175_000988 [Coemansia sp. RSA 1933]